MLQQNNLSSLDLTQRRRREVSGGAMLEASSKKARKASYRRPIEEEVWHHLGDPRFSRSFIKCYDLTVTVPYIATKSWVHHPSMDDEINGYLWVSLALSEAFRVIRKYDAYFVIAPYKTEHSIPSEVSGCGLCWDKLYYEIIGDQASESELIQFIPVDSFPTSEFSWDKLYQKSMQIHSS
jgi:hypothetical protein